MAVAAINTAQAAGQSELQIHAASDRRISCETPASAGLPGQKRLKVLAVAGVSRFHFKRFANTHEIAAGDVLDGAQRIIIRKVPMPI